MMDTANMLLVCTAALLLCVSHGFVSSPSSSCHRGMIPRFGSRVVHQKPIVADGFRLFAQEEEEEATDGEEVSENETVALEEEEVEEEPKEDPEMTALKEEISNLESALKAKRRQVTSAEDNADKFSKDGYARKVAEMENMRKARRSLQSLNKFSSQANVVSNFLPVLDELRSLNANYGQDEFGKQYNGLLGAFGASLNELQVQEYTVSVGEPLDSKFAVAVKQEYSDKFEKNVILEPLGMGLELQGNVMRMAECVVSLGSEAEAKAKEEAAAKAAAEAAAAAKAAEEAEEGGEPEGDVE